MTDNSIDALNRDAEKAGGSEQAGNETPPSQEKALLSRTLPSLWSPHMAMERKIWRKMLFIFTILLTAIIMGILSIYWGAGHSLQYNLPVFTVAIIDFDNGEVGPFLQQMGAAARDAAPGQTLGYISVPGSKYNYSNDEVRHALKQEEFWFGIVAQANATTAMNHAYSIGNSSYDPTWSVQVFYEEGRNSLAVDEFIYPFALEFLNKFVTTFALQKQRSLASANAGDATALARQAENPIPISFTLINIAPYVPTTAEAATEIGTIYLIIVSFLSVLMFNVLNEAMMGKIPTLRYYIYRMLVFPAFYFYLSLLYLALSCAWEIRFDKFYGASGYVIYWMLSWAAMLAFGLAVENVNNILGMPLTPLFFVFWVITNVTAGFFPIESLSNFYLWGLAWPLRHVLIGSKAIVFGTKNLLGLNFGVLISWIGVSVALQPLTIWVQMRRRKQAIEANKKQVLERVYGNWEGGRLGSKDEGAA